LHFVTAILPSFKGNLPAVALRVDRITLAQRSWRGRADDGTEFSFELAAPLRDGDAVWQTATHQYVVQQTAESLIAINLDVTASAAAGIGWAIGNLHLELSAEAHRLLAADGPALRKLLERLKVPYTTTTAVFRPGRFARGREPTYEVGPSHQHGGGATDQ
jgi:urease accessory protein